MKRKVGRGPTLPISSINAYNTFLIICNVKIAKTKRPITSLRFCYLYYSFFFFFLCLTIKTIIAISPINGSTILPPKAAITIRGINATNISIANPPPNTITTPISSTIAIIANIDNVIMFTTSFHNTQCFLREYKKTQANRLSP